jgi:MOSC domain-containing protein YiiM
VKVIAVNVGKPQTMVYHGKELVTGIYKSPVNSAVYLTRTNLDGDGQADLEFHGGEDKALCVYCEEHYSYWENHLGKQLESAAFGENVCVRGMLESEVCIGDTYELGEAMVQISQPRQPCHKLAKKHDTVDLPLKVQQTGYTGYYFRVLKEGWIPEKPSIRLISKHPAGVTVAFANQTVYQDKPNAESLKRILTVDELSASWRQSLTKILQKLEG